MEAVPCSSPGLGVSSVGKCTHTGGFRQNPTIEDGEEMEEFFDTTDLDRRITATVVADPRRNSGEEQMYQNRSKNTYSGRRIRGGSLSAKTRS